VALASLDTLGRGPIGWLARDELQRRVESLRSALEIVCRNVRDQPVRTLSGGNQQKAVLARLLAAGTRVLVLDEPTRGVDMGARQQIYEQIRALVAQGAAVLLISSELEELQGLCHRVLVLSRGEVQAVVERQDFESSQLLRAAFGEATRPQGAAS
jgi:ribose transport system ATP-binding protein